MEGGGGCVPVWFDAEHVRKCGQSALCVLSVWPAAQRGHRFNLTVSPLPQRGRIVRLMRPRRATTPPACSLRPPLTQHTPISPPGRAHRRADYRFGLLWTMGLCYSRPSRWGVGLWPRRGRSHNLDTHVFGMSVVGLRCLCTFGLWLVNVPLLQPYDSPEARVHLVPHWWHHSSLHHSFGLRYDGRSYRTRDSRRRHFCSVEYLLLLLGAG